MNREQAIEISNLAGFMVQAVEKYVLDRFGGGDRVLLDCSNLPASVRDLVQTVNAHRSLIADKSLAAISEAPSGAAFDSFSYLNSELGDRSPKRRRGR